ncbi:MAG: helix-turn-helix transcriptional regulator [Spirochaetaceae bacterium]|nr:helix-turn-helix transcriptional regulator [Spirochaetaceae bacterium]
MELDNKRQNINYYSTLKYIIDMSGLSVKDFANSATISESLIRHANDNWNPKYTTIEKICSVIHISIPSFYIISEYIEGNCKQVKVNYIIHNQQLEPEDLCKKLKAWRKKLKISEGKLAATSGFDKSNISKRENIKWNSIMLCSTLEIYAKCYGLTMKQLSSYLYEY